jgi:hypothetical protein
MLKGLYKVEFETPRRKAIGVVYVEEGKIYGGSSAFAYFGSYQESGDKVSGRIASKRHTHDPNMPSVFGIDEVNVAFDGVAVGDFAQFEGTAAETPSLYFKALLTRIVA